jgi:hypothetical protein
MSVRMPPKQRPQGSKSKARAASRRRSDHASVDRRWVYLGGGVAAVAVAALLGWLLLGGGTEDAEAKARTALTAAGCRLKVVPAVKNVGDHSDFPDPNARSPKWNTDPPTSGPHYGVTLIFGKYDEPVQIGRALHNLEHGGVYILYGKNVPAATVAKLGAFYDQHENGTILAPYPRLENRIALGAWVDPGLASAKSERGSGVLATCARFDENAYGTFLKAFQFKGPERFPSSSLLPGGN